MRNDPDRTGWKQRLRRSVSHEPPASCRRFELPGGLPSPATRPVLSGGTHEMPQGQSAYLTVDLMPGRDAWVSERAADAPCIRGSSCGSRRSPTARRRLRGGRSWAGRSVSPRTPARPLRPRDDVRGRSAPHATLSLPGARGGPPRCPPHRSRGASRRRPAPLATFRDPASPGALADRRSMKLPQDYVARRRIHERPQANRSTRPASGLRSIVTSTSVVVNGSNSSTPSIRSRSSAAVHASLSSAVSMSLSIVIDALL